MALSEEKLQQAQQVMQAIEAEIRKAVVGQNKVVEEVLIGLLAGGHVLLEGVPGLGKTLLVKALARTFDGDFKRIQFTPDLMPADVIGHTIFDANSGQFTTRTGPVFTHLLLADEINRAPAKTQAALLEVMQEQQVTLEGKPLPVPKPFMVLATQNPIEQEGTYPLPEAQLDRFLLKIRIDYPSKQEEIQLTRQVTQGLIGAELSVEQLAKLVKPATIAALQLAAAQIEVDERILEYAVNIVAATRAHPSISIGAGPRGGIALIRAARARALQQGRNFVTPDDIKAIAIPALRHRIATSAEAEIEGLGADALLGMVLETIPAPRA